MEPSWVGQDKALTARPLNPTPKPEAFSLASEEEEICSGEKEEILNIFHLVEYLVVKLKR